jgi:hypothetical protein
MVLPPPANGEQILALHVQPGRNNVVPMIGIDIVLEPLHAVWRKALGELAQRPKAARVPAPNILSAVMVRIADALLELQLEGLTEQSFDMRRTSRRTSR